jgi:hypothetical protein
MSSARDGLDQRSGDRGLADSGLATDQGDLAFAIARLLDEGFETPERPIPF